MMDFRAWFTETQTGRIMDYRAWFIETFMPFFKDLPIYNTMLGVVEDSPWHREANVGVHTNMVITQYMYATDDVVWNKDHLKGALACAFHDVGKPDAMQVCYKPERGEYRRFTGHERISTRLFEDIVVDNWSFFSEVLIPQDIYDIGWIVQMHLPYGRKRDKMQILVDTVHRVLPTSPEVYLVVLRSDQLGRISDNKSEKTKNLTDWMLDEYHAIQPNIKEPSQDDPKLWLLVGPSGAGKSTFTKTNHSQHAVVYSWDMLRYEYYDEFNPDRTPAERYKFVFDKSCEDKEFNQKIMADFATLVKQGVDIVVDNTNLSAKRRRALAEASRSKNYTVHVVMFPASLHQLKDRLEHRRERDMCPSVIERQFFTLTYPSYDKYCHNVIVQDTNLNETGGNRTTTRPIG